MKKILYFIPVALMSFAMTSCNLDYFPSDELNADSFLSTEAGAEAIIDGCYSMLKDETDYLHYASGNTYIRHYTQLTEFPSDNICNSNRTSDCLYESNILQMSSTLNNIGVLWWMAYKICFSVNNVIEQYEEGKSDAMDQLLGEAYYLRAQSLFHMVTMCAKPYVMGRDNLGVVIRTSTNTTETKRATVGECYDQVVADLIKAAELMKQSAKRGNGGYACHNTALGLLSRVYLYMGEWDKVISTIKDMGITNAASFDAYLEKDFANYYINDRDNKETLFCVAHTALEDRDTGGIGSMYMTDGIGWGEIYPSDPLLNLYERYPMDVRYTAFIHQQVYSDAKKFVYFPGIVNQLSHFSMGKEVTASGENYTFQDEGKTYTVKPKKVNGEYTEYYVEQYKGADMTKAEDLPARITPQLLMAPNGGAVPMYYVSKYCGQDGLPLASSPVLLRWGEIVLNLAEAYANNGKDAEALELVNVLRKRAGIPDEGMFSTSKLHGYDLLEGASDKLVTNNAVLNIVLDERRLELAFEGQRMFDLLRYQLNSDRRYAGVQYWEVIEPTSPRYQYPIPYDEITTSGIEQNPGY